MYSSITPRRTSASCLFWVLTFMPCATGVVHEAGSPFMPSICTRHKRQEPKASNCSVAQSLGILICESAAARITEVPSGTVTSTPSMVRVTSFAPVALRSSVILFDNRQHGRILYLIEYEYGGLKRSPTPALI